MSRNFEVSIPIIRAREDSEFYYLEGIASSTSIDQHETIFSLECQKNFEKQILEAKRRIESNEEVWEDDLVKAESEHDGRFNPIFDLGVIDNASLTDEKLWIRLKLDKENPLSIYYFKVIQNPDPKKGRPKSLGLSINGVAKKWRKEFNRELGKDIVVFDELTLKRVGIVRNPSNPDCRELYAVARSIRKQCIGDTCYLVSGEPETLGISDFQEIVNSRHCDCNGVFCSCETFSSSLADNAEATNLNNNAEAIIISPLRYSNNSKPTIQIQEERTVDELKEITDFPEQGDDREISLENSKFPVFSLSYAEGLKENWPSIWKKGGNIKGNEQFAILKTAVGKSASELSKEQKDAIKLREAWAARHLKDYRLAGVVAQIKWLVIGSRGVDHMKSVINKEKSEIAKRLIKKKKNSDS